LASVILVKLGGSLITDKSVPFSYRGNVVSSLGGEIASSRKRVVIVHGGGSFGHTVAKKYGLSSNHFSSRSDGVGETRKAMYDLNGLVCKSLLDAGVSPYVFAPFDLLLRGRTRAASWLNGLLDSGLTPTTFGDVSSNPEGFRVLSGDTMMYELARMLKPERCIFTLNVDGIYEGKRNTLVPRISIRKLQEMKVKSEEDATGGIGLKLKVAAKLASTGTAVSFVSGFRRKEFSKALNGLSFYGTTVISTQG
jgi:isopentenyl phosphate kinase